MSDEKKRVWFHWKINVFRYTSLFEHEKTEIDKGNFTAETIQACKAKLTRLANSLELFSYPVSSYEDDLRTFTGKDIRWKNWGAPLCYSDANDAVIAYATRYAERVYGEVVRENEDDKYGRTIEYQAVLSLHWKADDFKEG